MVEVQPFLCQAKDRLVGGAVPFSLTANHLSELEIEVSVLQLDLLDWNVVFWV